MRHPECLHPFGQGEFSGAHCCVCDGAPCGAVTVEVMRAHRLFDVELWSSAGEVAGVFRPPF